MTLLQILLQILQIIIALPLVFFVPGYFLASIIFREKHRIAKHEKLVLSVCLSLGISILLGLALASAKAFNRTNLWTGIIVMTIILAVIYYGLRRLHRRKAHQSSHGE